MLFLQITQKTWMEIPHEERTSYLQYKITEAFSQNEDDELLVV
jgi:hypothetical protein